MTSIRVMPQIMMKAAMGTLVQLGMLMVRLGDNDGGNMKLTTHALEHITTQMPLPHRLPRRWGDSFGYTREVMLSPLDAELGRVTNPRSMIKLRLVREEDLDSLTIRERVRQSPRFKRFFVSFTVQKRGFLEGCRHFIGIDGCHLKCHYDGVLLSAVSVDANSGYSLWQYVFEAENNDAWGFFLGLLHDFLGDLEHVTFMSDRQKVSKTANRLDFVKVMGCVKDVDEGAYKWLLENELDQWSRHAFDTIAKSDHITNNMSECFNSWLGEDRELPILSLLELYRRRVMKRLQCIFKAGIEWIIPLPPVIHIKINKMIEATRNVKVWYLGSEDFEVDDDNVNPCKTHVLVLGKQLCDCRMWQLSGIPCVHAIACLLHKNISNFEHYVDQKLRIPMYLQTYAYMVHLVPDKTS
ncbi:hypothetical protein Pint_23857 [Pistacia integerrima]|uniref:Uncharacterized protein n=1 Tax=Pistacia integerrima TaxID=434235 RepID=A0ACC0YLK3_9ROSI|nr:hypothetical protein Pint_23857 [Pistacia integerrima]